MKGLNIKKLAAIAVGGALVGSALAPLAAAINVTKADVVGATGAPVVNVVAGINAQASDFVWAGNIAAKVAQLATVDTALTGGEGTATPTGLSVDLAVGGESTYSTEYAKTYDGSSYPFDNTSTTAAEFIKAPGHGQLPFLYHASKSYRYNGSTYNTTMKETIGIEADVRFEYNDKDVKDIVALLDAEGDFNYVIDFGDGIPSQVSTTDTDKFTDQANDNIVVPFMGEEFTVQEVDMSSSPKTINLIKESAKAIYNEGDTIPGLTGKGAYAGEEMSVKVAAVTQSSGTAAYEARFDLYDSEGNLVDSQTLASGTYLQKNFLDAEGAYAMETVIYISGINIEPTTSKGAITMVVGKNVVTIGNDRVYPYDETNTDTTTWYWAASIDENTSATSVGINTVTKVTVKNREQVWNTQAPLWSTSSSLTEKGIEEAAAGGDTAHFLQGEETGLGYDFIKLKFKGFKQDQDKTKIIIGNKNIVYVDADDTSATIPFYFALPGQPSTGTPSQKTITLNGTNFYAKCYKGTVDIDVFDGNKLNGAVVNFGILPSDDHWVSYVATDNGPKGISDANVGNEVDINGVAYTIVADLNGAAYGDNNGATLRADGNCAYASEEWGTDGTQSAYLNVNNTATYSQIGTGSVDIKTVYFDDTNTTRTPGDLPIYFAKSGMQDTYRYRQYYSTSGKQVYLLLDSTTAFSNTFDGVADVNFVGTDPVNAGDKGITAGTPAAAGYFPYYWPDTVEFGNDAADETYITAIFGVQGNTTDRDNFRVHIDTYTNNLITLPNTKRDGYDSDVNYVDTGEPTWTLKARTDVATALHAGITDFGVIAELTDDMETVTFTIPETQLYLSLTLMGEGATMTVTGGETEEGVLEGETVTIAGKDITVSAINYTTGTCTIAGETYPRIVPVGQLVFTDSPAPAGNHIIVGGYMVNKLAENVVLGDGSTLQEALTAPGDVVAEVLANGNIVVAGYTATDTVTAARELISALDVLA